MTLRRLVPSMNALFAFETAARLGNFAQAAKELSVTPPAVSRMIARLEEHLGVRLIHRLPTGNRLTDDGAILFEGIAKSFAGIEQALLAIEARRSGSESVTLSVSTAFTTHWLMPRLQRFQADLPTVDLRFQLLPGPLGGPVDDVDLGMRFGGFTEGHDVTDLAPEILLPICSPGYRRSPSSEGFQPDVETIINLSKAQPDWSGLFSFPSERPPSHSLAFSDYAIVVQAALLGQGVALGWLSVVAHWLCVDALVPATSRIMVTGRPCQLVRSRARPLRPAVAAVRDWIASEVATELRQIDAKFPELELRRTLDHRIH